MCLKVSGEDILLLRLQVVSAWIAEGGRSLFHAHLVERRKADGLQKFCCTSQFLPRLAKVEVVTTDWQWLSWEGANLVAKRRST